MLFYSIPYADIACRYIVTMAYFRYQDNKTGAKMAALTVALYS